MPLYRPSELRSFLAEEGVVALKSLSQNFLVDGNIVAKIGQLLRLSPDEAVLEIGPGPGVVTETLSARTSLILTVEKDAAFAKLIDRFAGVKSLHADALKIDLAKAARSHFSPQLMPIKVVSNLPYATASAFLSALLPNNAAFKTLTLMLPREIADKMRAEGGAHWLRAARKIFCRAVSWYPVSRHCFFPQPQTESVLGHFELQSPLSPIEGVSFLHWLKSTSSLKKRKGSSTSIHHTPKQRARLTPEQWLAIWRRDESRNDPKSA